MNQPAISANNTVSRPAADPSSCPRASLHSIRGVQVAHRDRPNHWIGVLVFLTVTFTAAPAPGLASALELASDSNRDVLVSRATPGGDVLLVSTERQVGELGIAQTVIRRSILTDRDEDGVVLFERESAPPTSAVVAVDLESGDYGLLRLGGHEPTTHRHVELHIADSARDVGIEVRSAFLVWVRPGDGAWVGRVSDGAVWDTLDQSGLLSWPLDRLEPVDSSWSTASLDRARSGDLVVITDLDELTLAVQRIGEPTG